MFKKILNKLFPIAYVEYSITQRTKGVMVVKTYVDTTFVKSVTYLHLGSVHTVSGRWINGETGEKLEDARILSLIKCKELYPDE